MVHNASPTEQRQGVTSGAAVPPAVRQLVLASASPRRHDLLQVLGASFRVLITNGEEQSDNPPEAIVALLPPCPVPLDTHPTLLAWRKAQAACAEAPDSVIIGADTIVVLDGLVLGKPRDAAHAHAMLTQLAGRVHTVYTGVVVLHPTDSAQPPAVTLELAASDVTIAPLTSDEIEAYIATGEPMDKAGAYGIQGLGGQLVRAVAGSYTCVVGLPITLTHRLLVQAGIPALRDPTEAYYDWVHAQGKEPLPCPPTFP
ncbi:MAG: Maf family protein [Kouleothrix sp.]